MAEGSPIGIVIFIETKNGRVVIKVSTQYRSKLLMNFTFFSNLVSCKYFNKLDSKLNNFCTGRVDEEILNYFT